MSDYQDYYAEQDTPCDPYYDETCEKAPDGPMEEEDMMMEEESAAAGSLYVFYWGLVPILDLASGMWQMSDWAQTDDDDTLDATTGECSKCPMQQQAMLEIASGSFSLLAWGAAQFMGVSAPFVILSKVQILSETAMIFMQYRGWQKYYDDQIQFSGAAEDEDDDDEPAVPVVPDDDDDDDVPAVPDSDDDDDGPDLPDSDDDDDEPVVPDSDDSDDWCPAEAPPGWCDSDSDGFDIYGSEVPDDDDDVPVVPDDGRSVVPRLLLRSTSDEVNDDAPTSKNFAYGVHVFGLVYSAASMMAVADAYALPEEEMDMEYYGEEYQSDDDIAYTDDDYY